MTLIIVPPFQPVETIELPTIGTAFGGGFYAGRFALSAKQYALVMAPVAGRSSGMFFSSNIPVTALTSVDDGWTNTAAFSGPQFTVNAWTRALRVSGFDDWYTPSRNELEMLYRAFKPTTAANDTSASTDSNRDIGIAQQNGRNTSTLEVGTAYVAGDPTQTGIEGFRSGEAQALDATTYPVAHWTSTAAGTYAAFQRMNTGEQNTAIFGQNLLVVAVRRIALN